MMRMVNRRWSPAHRTSSVMVSVLMVAAVTNQFGCGESGSAESAADGSFDASSFVLAEPGYSWCHDTSRTYALTDDEARWCELVPLQRCPAMEQACAAERAVLVGGTDSDLRRVERNEDGSGEDAQRPEPEVNRDRSSDSAALAGLVQCVAWLAVAAAGLLAVGGLLALIRRSRWSVAPVAPVPVAPRAPLPVAYTQPAAVVKRTSDMLTQAARSAATGGRYSESLQMTAAAVCAWLDEQGAVPLRGSRTTGERVRMLPGTHAYRTVITRILRQADAARFGTTEPTAELATELLQLWQQIQEGR